MRKRKTIQQQLVIDALHQLTNHPTAQEVSEKIQEQYKDISIATVYSNLKDLVKDGKVRVLPFASRADRYEYNLSDHSHIRCITCGNFQDLPVTGTAGIDKQAADISDYLVKGYEILFHGICPVCQEAEQTEKEKDII